MLKLKFCACVIFLLGLLCTPSKSQSGHRRSSAPSIYYDALYDFSRPQLRTNENVTVIGGFTGRGCGTRGKLKISLVGNSTDNSRRRVLIDLGFYNPTGLVFHLGDSSTNDGNGSDASTQSNDAEVLATGRNFIGYLNKNAGNALAFNISDLYSSRLTLLVSDNTIFWIPNNNNNMNIFSDPNFFALDGEPDTIGPIDNNLYIGINQPIFGTAQGGSGLCQIGIKFLKNIII